LILSWDKKAYYAIYNKVGIFAQKQKQIANNVALIPTEPREKAFNKIEYMKISVFANTFPFSFPNFSHTYLLSRTIPISTGIVVQRQH